MIKTGFVASQGPEEMVSVAIFWDKDCELTNVGQPMIKRLAEE